MADFKRTINMDLPKGQSAFLFGARKVGKSTFLKQKFPKSIYYDLLKNEVYLELLKAPNLLREQVLSQKSKAIEYPVIIDEVQKVPALLDEVHWLIENEKIGFVLCGSSARKLKRGQANMLGGRAWKFEMFPLVSNEVANIDLLQVLNSGMIPSHYRNPNYKKSLKGYIGTYLKEEIFDEGLARNIPAFARFFDSVGYSHGEMINFDNIARESAVNSRTVRDYYQILVDTLIGTFVEPYKKRQSRDVIRKTPKFYLFDVGVAGAITKRSILEKRGELFGKAFEHFIFTEINAYRSYSEKDFRINYWRTKSKLEVDFILGEGEIAIEIKGNKNISTKDLLGIKTFTDEHKPKKSYVVSTVQQERLIDDINILPWKKFLRMLWDGEII
jgi:predicted AAA+ superfamily ATPase